MLKVITAIERDGFDIRTLTLKFDIPSKNFDLVSAIINAATDFCKTEEGKEVYEHNCNNFNWADFAMHVSNEFCRKYGFEMLDVMCEDMVVDWDEQLVNECEIEEDE